MKKIMIIFLGYCVLNPIFSQAYHPIPTDSVWWVEESSSPYMGGPCIEFRKTYIYPVGNVSISGETYCEFRSNVLVAYDYFGPFPSPCPPNGYSVSNQFYAFIRNDSVNQKVYIYDTVNLHDEVLLYDFNLNIGDTIPGINGYQIGECPTDTFIVQAIDSVDIVGEYRKRFEVITNGTGWSPIYIIESIGSTLGFAYPIFCPFEMNTGLICYHHQQFEYGNTTNSYCIQTLNVLPNTNQPEVFFINLGNNRYEIKIMGTAHISCIDALGKQTFSLSVQDSAMLNFNDQKAGIYYLIVNGNKIKTEVFKIMVSH